MFVLPDWPGVVLEAPDPVEPDDPDDPDEPDAHDEPDPPEDAPELPEPELPEPELPEPELPEPVAPDWPDDPWDAELPPPPSAAGMCSRHQAQPFREASRLKPSTKRAMVDSNAE